MFDTVARVVCEARCLPRKELYESFAVARRVLRRHRGGPILDLAGGHGLTGWVMLMLDRASTEAVVVDKHVPVSASRLVVALGARWPGVTSRWHHREADLSTGVCTAETRVVGVHACGVLTDRVLDVAIDAGARVAVLPCCHSKAKLDAGGLVGWMSHDLAVDTLRAHRLADAGFRVYTTTIADEITPMNRLLLGTPVRE